MALPMGITALSYVVDMWRESMSTARAIRHVRRGYLLLPSRRMPLRNLLTPIVSCRALLLQSCQTSTGAGESRVKIEGLRLDVVSLRGLPIRTCLHLSMALLATGLLHGRKAPPLLSTLTPSINSLPSLLPLLLMMPPLLTLTPLSLVGSGTALLNAHAGGECTALTPACMLLLLCTRCHVPPLRLPPPITRVRPLSAMCVVPLAPIVREASAL